MSRGYFQQWKVCIGHRRCDEIGVRQIYPLLRPEPRTSCCSGSDPHLELIMADALDDACQPAVVEVHTLTDLGLVKGCRERASDSSTTDLPVAPGNGRLEPTGQCERVPGTQEVELGDPGQCTDVGHITIARERSTGLHIGGVPDLRLPASRSRGNDPQLTSRAPGVNQGDHVSGTTAFYPRSLHGHRRCVGYGIGCVGVHEEGESRRDRHTPEVAPWAQLHHLRPDHQCTGP